MEKYSICKIKTKRINVIIFAKQLSKARNSMDSGVLAIHATVLNAIVT